MIRLSGVYCNQAPAALTLITTNYHRLALTGQLFFYPKNILKNKILIYFHLDSTMLTLNNQFVGQILTNFAKFDLQKSILSTFDLQEPKFWTSMAKFWAILPKFDLQKSILSTFDLHEPKFWPYRLEKPNFWLWRIRFWPWKTQIWP